MGTFIIMISRLLVIHQMIYQIPQDLIIIPADIPTQYFPPIKKMDTCLL